MTFGLRRYTRVHDSIHTRTAKAFAKFGLKRSRPSSMKGPVAARLCLYGANVLYIVVHPCPLARPPLALPLLWTLALRCGPAELVDAFAHASSSFTFLLSAASARFCNTPGAVATVWMSRTCTTATPFSMRIISGNARLTTSSKPTDWEEEDGFAPRPLREGDINEGCVDVGNARRFQKV